MKRSMILLGFLLLIVIDTFVQIGFKLAGNNTLPVTLDLPWLERVVREPWLLGVLGGIWSGFSRLHDTDQACTHWSRFCRFASRDRDRDHLLGAGVRRCHHALASAWLLRDRFRCPCAGGYGKLKS